jgi:hypothetical protein
MLKFVPIAPDQPDEHAFLQQRQSDSAADTATCACHRDVTYLVGRHTTSSWDSTNYKVLIVAQR